MTRIMIVDDAAIIRQPIEAALRREGFDAISAADGREALAMLRTQAADLILLDLAMPVMDGLAFLESIRTSERTRAVPVIVLTSVVEKQKVMSAVKLGISAYLLKSKFSLDELLAQVRKCLPGEPDCTAATTPPQAKATSAAPDATVSSRAPAITQPSPPAPPSPPPGDPVEALKSLKPVISRSELEAKLKACSELKAFSPTVSLMLRVTADPQCSMDKLVRAISQDHAIALKILKLANSAVYTRGEPVESLQKAVMRIGLDQVRQALLNINVMQRFNTDALTGLLNCAQFWEHAIACGIIAAEIVRRRDEKLADSAFTMGLLHDVGRMFYVEQFGPMYKQALDAARELALPLEHVESRMLLVNHADVMDRLLHAWKFPKALINPIVFHHLSAGNIRNVAPREIELIGALALANRLAHAMMLGSAGNDVIYPTEDLCQLLRLDPSVLQTIEATTREEADKVKFAMLSTSNESNWPQLRDEYRKQLAQPFRPLFVSGEPKFDAYALFCRQLAVAEESAEPPNVGVVHVVTGRERAAVSARYTAEEERLGVGRLPILVLTPSAKLTPEPSLLTGRRCTTLLTPTAVSRFISAVNQLLPDCEVTAVAA